MTTTMVVVAATTTSRSERMRVSRKPARSSAVVIAAVLALALGCGKKASSTGQAGPSALIALPDLAEPSGVLADLRVARPDAIYRTLRELGRPWSALLPAGFSMFSASLLGLPPLSADSFDTDLPEFGLLTQGTNGPPGWVFALHVVSGPELVAKLCTGDHSPFRAASTRALGLQRLEPNLKPGATPFSLGVFDQYLLVASSAEVLLDAGPYAARMLPRRTASEAPLAIRFSQRALEGSVVPGLRALWAEYRTRLTRLDQSDRSAHGGRSPDFADPAQVILGADAVVEAALSLVEGAALLEIDVEPSADRLDLTLELEPQAGSDVQAKVSSLSAGDAQGLLLLPVETSFALGFTRTSEEREQAGKVAGDDWVRLLGDRLTARDADQLRSVLADWELGRGAKTSYGFLGGNEPGAFLVTDVADAERLKRASAGLFGLLALPGLRAPLAEFLGAPRATSAVRPPDALPGAMRQRVVFTPSGGRPARVAPLSFAWLVEDQLGFAAASHNADAALKAVVESARGRRATLADAAGLTDSVRRVGEQAALYSYLDARVLFGSTGPVSPAPAPVLLTVGKRGTSAWVRLEIAKPAVDLAAAGLLGK